MKVLSNETHTYTHTYNLTKEKESFNMKNKETSFEDKNLWHDTAERTNRLMNGHHLTADP